MAIRHIIVAMPLAIGTEAICFVPIRADRNRSTRPSIAGRAVSAALGFGVIRRAAAVAAVQAPIRHAFRGLVSHFPIALAWAVMGYAMPAVGETYHIRDVIPGDGAGPFPEGLVRLAELPLPASPEGDEVALDARGFRSTTEIEIFRAIDAAVFARPTAKGAGRG